MMKWSDTCAELFARFDVIPVMTPMIEGLQMRKLAYRAAAGAACLSVIPASAAPAYADAPAVQLSGAIFTTNVTGAPVNLNIYANKADVYLNGGPGIHAPDEAAGLPAGTYTFQVTDPSGKTLLSTDPESCRQVTVDDTGVFQDVLPSGNCPHSTGADAEDLGLTVQLFPYDDTPNHGGVYKVWLTPTSRLDCDAPGNKHCFVPRYSKTDNFKVGNEVPIEIDTRFSKPGIDGYLDGMKVDWTDTLGAGNAKYSEYNPSILAFHEAHVEAAEPGTHMITIADQPGCAIDDAHGPDGATYPPVDGALSLSVTVSRNTQKEATYFVDVNCKA